MGRIKASERARQRILSDDELRAVWTAAEATRSLFDPYVGFLPLTAVRRMEAARMTWAEFDGANWQIPAARIKGKRDFLVPLSRAALDILTKLPMIGRSDGFVFTNDGVRPAGDYSNCKADLQRR